LACFPLIPCDHPCGPGHDDSQGQVNVQIVSRMFASIDIGTLAWTQLESGNVSSWRRLVLACPSWPRVGGPRLRLRMQHPPAMPPCCRALGTVACQNVVTKPACPAPHPRQLGCKLPKLRPSSLCARPSVPHAEQLHGLLEPIQLANSAAGRQPFLYQPAYEGLGRPRVPHICMVEACHRDRARAVATIGVGLTPGPSGDVHDTMAPLAAGAVIGASRHPVQKFSHGCEASCHPAQVRDDELGGSRACVRGHFCFVSSQLFFLDSISTSLLASAVEHSSYSYSYGPLPSPR